MLALLHVLGHDLVDGDLAVEHLSGAFGGCLGVDGSGRFLAAQLVTPRVAHDLLGLKRLP